MVRRTFLSAALVLAGLAMAVSSVGCSMCASPYDYTGPTETGGAAAGGCSQCAMPTGRAGSILSAHEPVVYETPMNSGPGFPSYEGEVVGPVFLYEEPVEPVVPASPQPMSAVPSRRVR